MAEQDAHRPGPGRETQAAAFAAVTKRIAERNAKAQRLARAARTAREERETARKRRWELQ